MDPIRDEEYRRKQLQSVPCVHFQDNYSGLWLPLSHLYYSNSSNSLVSAHAASAVKEAESHYCPQCMTRYPDEEVHNYRNRCPQCFQCPLCCSVLSMSSSSQHPTATLVLQCPSCQWNSGFVGLFGHGKDDFLFADRERDAELGIDDHFRSLLSVLEDKYGCKDSKAPLSRSDVTLSSHPVKVDTSVEMGPVPNDFLAALPVDSMFSSIEAKLESVKIESSLITDLWPQRVRLRSKYSVRAREGKMPILVKPKLLPLGMHTNNFIFP